MAKEEESLKEIILEESDDEMPQQDDLAVSVETHMICHCKNACRRKSGRTRGCVCRENGLPCSANCDCGPQGKPCSNRKEVSSNAQAAVAQLPSSAFDRHQATASKSREEIGTFITTITPEEKDRLLLELLSNGQGSLDYAKNLIAGDMGHPNPKGPLEIELPEWCVCGVCRPMPTPEKNKCCGKCICVTSYELFQNICIDREVLTVAIRAAISAFADVEWISGLLHVPET